jgi:hypothetical protein
MNPIAPLLAPFVTRKKRDVTSGTCQCVTDQACQNCPQGAENCIDIQPSCRAGACVCRIGNGTDSCDPSGTGVQRCDPISGACVCNADSICRDRSPAEPFCAASGECVCDTTTCKDGFACIDGDCVCDSDEACVELTGGYHSVCIDHQCGCDGAAGCATVGPPMFEQGPPMKFSTHRAMRLVCE